MNFQETIIGPGQAAAAFEVLPGTPQQRLVLLCDHACNYIPPEYGSLGLPASELERHIGYDTGVDAIVRALSVRLNAAAVLSNFSRLLIDPNRGLDDPTLIMQISDGSVVPGNANIDALERSSRIERFYRPYHAAIDTVLDDILGRGMTPIILSVHSFTSTWKGVLRPWHAGILWQPGWASFSGPLLAALQKDPALIIGDNEPYAGGLVGDTLFTHGAQRRLPHALLEIRQDLIVDEIGQGAWIERLVELLPGLVGQHD